MLFGPDAAKIKMATATKRMGQGAREMPEYGTGVERLQYIMKMPPLTIDCKELQATLEKAEDEGADALMLKKGITKLEYAERVQMAARVKAITKEITELLDVPNLDLDCDQLYDAVEFARDKEGIAQELIDKADAKLEEAEAAQEQHRQEMRAAAIAAIEQLCSVPSMVLDPDAIQKAIKEGDGWIEADDPILETARAKIREAARRTRAASSLQYLSTEAPLDVNAAKLRDEMAEAVAAGVPMAAVRDSQLVLRAAEQAQAPSKAAAALLSALTEVPALEVDTTAASKAIAEAVASHVAAPKIEKAQAKVKDAEAQQVARDNAACDMIAEAAKPSFTIKKVQDLVKVAKENGVADDIIETVEAKIAGDSIAPAETIKETAKLRASAKRQALDKKDADAAAALSAATKNRDAAKVTAEVALQEAQGAMLKAMDLDQKVLKKLEEGGDTHEAIEEEASATGAPAMLGSGPSKASSIAASAANLLTALEETKKDKPLPITEQHDEPREETEEEFQEDLDWLHSARYSRVSAMQKSSSSLGGAPSPAPPLKAASSVKLPPVVEPVAHTQAKSLWEQCMEARTAAVAAEEKAAVAWEAFEAAVHKFELAERAALRYKAEAGWAAKEEAAYEKVAVSEAKRKELEKAAALAKVQPRKATDEKAKSVMKKTGQKKKGGGCCGGATHDVIEINVEDDVTEGPTGAPPAPPPPSSEKPESTGPMSTGPSGVPLDGLDGLSWTPLHCAKASDAKMSALLKGLAIAGAFGNGIVCEAVASEMAAVDPTAAARFVSELASALPSLPASTATALGGAADVWLSKVVLFLIEAKDAEMSAGDTILKVVGSSNYVFKLTLRSLLETHYAYSKAAAAAAAEDEDEDGASSERVSAAAGGLGRLVSVASTISETSGGGGSAELQAIKAAIENLYTCLAHLLGSSMRGDKKRSLEMLPLWQVVDPPGEVKATPAQALAETAKHFADHLFGGESLYKSRRDGKKLTDADKANERVVLALINLFVESPDRLTGFQRLVQGGIFRVYLAKGTELRKTLCGMLSEPSSTGSTMDPGLVERIGTDDTLVSQEFFWSKAGMKLFGEDDDLKDENKLYELLVASLKQQPAILLAFLQQTIARVEKGGAGPELGSYMKVAVMALGAHVKSVGVVHFSSSPDPDVNEAVSILLMVATKYREQCFDAVLEGCKASESSSVLLDAFAGTYFRTHIGIPAAHANLEVVHHKHHHHHHPNPRVSQRPRASQRPRTSTADRRASRVSLAGRFSQLKKSQSVLEVSQAANRKSLLDPHAKINGLDSLATPDDGEGGEGGGSSKRSGSLSSKSAGPVSGKANPTAGGDAAKDEAIIMTLANFFVAQPATLTAFGQLVPRVFETHLKLGTPARERLNGLLLQNAFEETLEALICKTDELVGAPFFWHADIIPLCTKARIAKSFPTLSKARLVGADGGEILLYARLLAFLLRLSSSGAAETSEIARRTVEVLDQFERNPEQQQFIMTIFNTLEKLAHDTPEVFADIPLTVLSGVCENGVQTISSVQGEGMELCERAMTTLLQGYISNEPPTKWKKLFKDATNIAFMVKYMFREQLEMAKTKFQNFVDDKSNFKKMKNASDVKDMMSKLVQATLFSYGEVGIFDPEKLAEIDFLNKPELLVELVAQSKSRESRVDKRDMQLLTDVTLNWMKFMISKQFPPLTPHHTQAFIVMMMAHFFQDYLGPDKLKKTKMKLKCFVAQMSTGEGKSIVIAMCSIFMVKLYGLKVHVLENNEGLLERDYATNAPFYEMFGIKSGKDLSEPGVQICYTLKAAINKHFLRGMVANTLELSNTVLIVDEVDDLIVNERPNAHYVKVDVERTPDLIKCLAALKMGQGKPDGVEEGIWARASHDMDVANAKEKDVHYRVVTKDDGKQAVIMLNNEGQVPKVPLTAPWLKALAYKLCGDEPTSDSHFACVCTPYVFNMYAGIFGLTGSVGGKAELNYLTETYHAVKFDVPRFLDTCIGDARKVVKNHGVELLDGPDAQIARVVALAKQYFREVPVLIIASSNEELGAIHKAVASDGAVPSDEVQRFAEFDENGRSMKDEWQTVIDDATKRLGGAEDNRCRVTVTDRFGGRGHDFQVVDKEANANGGMLVIATSVPDEREWIQWKGRTARQDRPGQFYIILDAKAKPFSAKSGLKDKVKKAASDDLKVEMLLECADDGIDAKLKQYAGEQSSGEKLNEVALKYFAKHPRDFDAPWPQEDIPTDKVLRQFMTTMIDSPPAEVKKQAKEMLGIVLD